MSAAIPATATAAATATATAPEEGITKNYWIALASFIGAIGLCIGSISFVNGAINSTNQWTSIQNNIPGYTAMTTIAATLLMVAFSFLMFEYYATSHILLAAMTAFAAGLASTALAVASISRT